MRRGIRRAEAELRLSNPQKQPTSRRGENSLQGGPPVRLLKTYDRVGTGFIVLAAGNTCMQQTAGVGRRCRRERRSSRPDSGSVWIVRVRA